TGAIRAHRRPRGAGTVPARAATAPQARAGRNDIIGCLEDRGRSAHSRFPFRLHRPVLGLQFAHRMIFSAPPPAAGMRLRYTGLTGSADALALAELAASGRRLVVLTAQAG